MQPRLIPKTKSTLGKTEPDAISAILGTGYLRFASPTGIHGLAKETDGRLDILAVDASTPGFGQFREFIKRCKDEYTSIYVWEVWNPIVADALKRYEFHEVSEFQIDAVVEGWCWLKESK